MSEHISKLTGRTRTPGTIVPRDEWAWLENTLGLIDPFEGEWLSERAAEVPTQLPIVEVGSHTGLSTCWLAAGSRQGRGARVYAIDPWPDPGYADNDDPFGLGSGDAVFERFLSNIKGTTQEVRNVDYSPWVSVMRMTSEEAAVGWRHQIGLLFIDAIHTYEGVKKDVGLWSDWIVPGGWIALNDYWADPGRTIKHGAAYVAEELYADGNWEEGVIIWNTWVAKRK